MMAHRVDVVRASWDAFNRGARDELVELFDPDLEIDSPLAAFRGRPYRGREGFRDWFRDVDESFKGFDMHLDEVRELPDGRVLGLGSIRFVGRGSGLELDQEFAWLVTFEGDLIRKLKVLPDQAKALELAGLAS